HPRKGLPPQTRRKISRRRPCDRRPGQRQAAGAQAAKRLPPAIEGSRRHRQRDAPASSPDASLTPCRRPTPQGGFYGRAYAQPFADFGQDTSETPYSAAAGCQQEPEAVEGREPRPRDPAAEHHELVAAFSTTRSQRERIASLRAGGASTTGLSPRQTAEA